MKSPEYTNYLIQNALSTSSHNLLYNPDDTVQLDLIGFSALTKDDDNYVGFPSLLIRHVIFRSLAASNKPGLTSFTVVNALPDVRALIRYTKR